MYWPKFSIKKLMRLLGGSRGSHQSGASCSYVRWTKRVGLKMYTSRWERDRCHKLQRRAEASRLAPKTGGVFEIKLVSVRDFGAPYPCARTIYCYWTEHLNHPSRTPSLKRALADLREKLRTIGLYHHDLARRNVGVKNGTLVCLDFDTASCATGGPL